MIRSRLWALGLAGALALPGDAAHAQKPTPQPCADGLFALEEARVTELGTPIVQIVFQDSQVLVLDACPMPAAVTEVKVGPKSTRIRAKWTACPGFPGKVVLKAKIAAPGCATITGVLRGKRSKPKRLRLRAARLAPAALVASLRQSAVQERMLDENFPTLIRAAAEVYNPELVALIGLGPAALDEILPQFERPAGLADDTPLSLLAYALERIGDPRAVPVLTDWLDAHLFTALGWATDFVTHTIKVLDAQEGLHTASYAYLIDDKLDAIAQARAGQAVAVAVTTGPGPQARAAIRAAQNQCAKSIVVTGINDDGQQESITIGYNTVFFDIHEQIELETGPAARAELERKRDGFRVADEEFYGNTDYRAIGDVSTSSNCGGSVTERLLNAVAARKGLPLNLGAGNGTIGKVDGQDVSAADVIRDVARKFGTEISADDIDTLTVIAHEREGGASAHVEIPISDGSDSVVVYSKDNQGRPRLHTVDKFSALNPFAPVQRRYNFRPFLNYAQTTPKFYRIDPNRIVSITVDSSACPCEFAFGGVIPVAFTQPTETETDQRVITVAGTVGSDATQGTLRINDSPQPLDIGGGGFSNQVVLRSGDNTLRVAVDGPDGRRGCAERIIRSTTPKTTISATLTWNLSATDVDLYVTQPDGETAWYSAKTTNIGGRLDVDNTSGFGPENYFLSSEEGDTILPGTYAVRVHYYADHERTTDTPSRIVEWRVVVLLNEGTPHELRKFYRGSLSTDDAGNDAPGASGSDWATVMEVNLELASP